MFARSKRKHLMDQSTFEIKRYRVTYNKNKIIYKFLILYNDITGKNISYKQLLSSKRDRYTADARAVIQAVILLKTDFTYQRIADMFKQKTYATIMHNVKKVNAIPELSKLLQELAEVL